MSVILEPILEVRDLHVSFAIEGGLVEAVRGVSFDVNRGEVLGIVGESGSGKSATVTAIMRLFRSRAVTVTGTAVRFNGEDLLTVDERRMREVRGNDLAMVFQDPTTSFNPVRTIGHQIAEAILVHRFVSRVEAARRAVELLDSVGIPNPRVRAHQYPHEFSGGMRQRAMIAMALANDPQVIIADEPTTALDVSVQAQIMQLLRDVRERTGAAIILITHDLGLVAENADRALVMYGGKVVEVCSVRTVFERPHHPYTRGLLASLPRLEGSLDVLPSIPGQPPSLSPPPAGCSFEARCDTGRGRETCRRDLPLLEPVPGPEPHLCACHFADESAGVRDGVVP